MTPNVCHLTPALKRYVQHQWRVIDVLFAKINTATSDELHELETAKLALEYLMTTGKVDVSNEHLLKRFDKELLLETKIQTLQTLQTGLKKRFDRVGKTADTSTINIDHVKTIEGLTPTHIEAIQEVFGGARNLIPFILPTLEDLTNQKEKACLSGSTYEDVMYPNNQTDTEKRLVEEDKINGLISYRPNHWEYNSYLYLYSMQQELENIGGHLFLIDNTIKPEFLGGNDWQNQQYTTPDGHSDPLLPFINETLKTEEEPNPNRFNHTWHILQQKLLPKITQAIKEAFIKKGLSVLNIQVMLIPATLANLYYTTHPIGQRSTTTDTSEWSSTPYSKTDQSLVVGLSFNGGACYVLEKDHETSDETRGFRLAVML